ncbi:MAG: ferritin-like domain-containing protein [Polyangiales bacterium]
MRSGVNLRRLRAAIAGSLLAAGCGAEPLPTAVGDCTDPVLRVNPFSGDAGDAGDAALPDDGAVSLEACGVHCPAHVPHPYGWQTELTRCAPVTTDAGAQVECRYRLLCPGGRACEGDAPVAPADASAGELLAAMATLEAGSVRAFASLARELRAHRAPPSLLRAARRAMRDERRHARSVGSLAQRYGARPARPSPAPRTARALEALARENAVEGCVRETWGALVATWQARRAEDPRVREAMTDVARDELAHAALAWRVAAWAEARLPPDARERVVDARRRAVDALCDEASRGAPVGAAARAIGWPGPEETRRMFVVLRAQTWAA